MMAAPLPPPPTTTTTDGGDKTVAAPVEGLPNSPCAAIPTGPPPPPSPSSSPQIIPERHVAMHATLAAPFVQLPQPPPSPHDPSKATPTNNRYNNPTTNNTAAAQPFAQSAVHPPGNSAAAKRRVRNERKKGAKATQPSQRQLANAPNSHVTSSSHSNCLAAESDPSAARGMTELSMGSAAPQNAIHRSGNWAGDLSEISNADDCAAPQQQPPAAVKAKPKMGKGKRGSGGVARGGTVGLSNGSATNAPSGVAAAPPPPPRSLASSGGHTSASGSPRHTHHHQQQQARNRPPPPASSIPLGLSSTSSTQSSAAAVGCHGFTTQSLCGMDAVTSPVAGCVAATTVAACAAAIPPAPPKIMMRPHMNNKHIVGGVIPPPPPPFPPPKSRNHCMSLNAEAVDLFSAAGSASNSLTRASLPKRIVVLKRPSGAANRHQHSPNAATASGSTTESVAKAESSPSGQHSDAAGISPRGPTGPVPAGPRKTLEERQQEYLVARRRIFEEDLKSSVGDSNSSSSSSSCRPGSATSLLCDDSSRSRGSVIPEGGGGGSGSGAASSLSATTASSSVSSSSATTSNLNSTSSLSFQAAVPPVTRARPRPWRNPNSWQQINSAGVMGSGAAGVMGSAAVAYSSSPLSRGGGVSHHPLYSHTPLIRGAHHRDAPSLPSGLHVTFPHSSFAAGLSPMSSSSMMPCRPTRGIMPNTNNTNNNNSNMMMIMLAAPPMMAAQQQASSVGSPNYPSAICQPLADSPPFSDTSTYNSYGVPCDSLSTRLDCTTSDSRLSPAAAQQMPTSLRSSTSIQAPHPPSTGDETLTQQSLGSGTSHQFDDPSCLFSFQSAPTVPPPPDDAAAVASEGFADCADYEVSKPPVHMMNQSRFKQLQPDACFESDGHDANLESFGGLNLSDGVEYNRTAAANEMQ